MTFQNKNNTNNLKLNEGQFERGEEIVLFIVRHMMICWIEVQ